MAHPERVPLLDARLELMRLLSPNERDELAGATLPLVVTEGSLKLLPLLEAHNAFGAALLDGIVMSSLRLGGQTGIQLLGPGDVLLPGGCLLPTWLADFEMSTAGPVQLGLFGHDLLAAVYRWPLLMRGLYGCVGDQLERLTAQLVICQLPRADDRILSILWLLSESWGHVTPSGVRLQLSLTHEMLGALVGAARPTVTLALRKLSKQGAVVHEDSGWLLLEPPPSPTPTQTRILPPGLPQPVPSDWEDATEAAYREETYAGIMVSRLREQPRAERRQTLEKLQRVRSDRVRMQALRARIEEEALKRRRPPSS